MATEFIAEYGREANITLTPRGDGNLKVLIDGELVYHKREEGNIHPNLIRVRQMEAIINRKLNRTVSVPADD